MPSLIVKARLFFFPPEEKYNSHFFCCVCPGVSSIGKAQAWTGYDLLKLNPQQWREEPILTIKCIYTAVNKLEETPSEKIPHFRVHAALQC